MKAKAEADAKRLSTLEDQVAGLEAALTTKDEEMANAKAVFESEKLALQQTLATLKQTLAVLQERWHGALGTSSQQTAMSLKERDAAVGYASTLEDGVARLKKSSGCQRLFSTLAVYHSRTVGHGFSVWKEFTAASRHADLKAELERTKKAVSAARGAQDHSTLEIVAVRNELTAMQGRYDEVQARLTDASSEIRVYQQQTAAARAALASAQSSEAATRGRLVSLEERMAALDSEHRMAQERLRTIDKELEKREEQLRAREARLVETEGNLAAIMSENAMLNAKLTHLVGEVEDTKEAHKGTLKTMASVKTKNVEYEAKIAALVDAEAALVKRETEVQERLSAAMAREEKLRAREQSCAERERAVTENTVAREKVMEARQLLIRQREEDGKSKESELRRRLEEMGDSRALLERATAAESHVAALESQKRALELKIDDLLKALKERVRGRGSGDDGADVGAMVTASGATDSELSLREKRLKEQEANVTTRLATLSSMEARVREKEAKLDKVLSNAERAQMALHAKLQAAEAAEAVGASVSATTAVA